MEPLDPTPKPPAVVLISTVFALLGVLLFVYAALATVSGIFYSPGAHGPLPVSFLFVLAGIAFVLGFLLLLAAIWARRRQMAGWWLSTFILVGGLFISVMPVLNTVGRLSRDSSPTEVAVAAVVAALFLGTTWAMAATRNWFSSARAEPPDG